MIAYLIQKLSEPNAIVVNIGRSAMPEAGNIGFAGVVGSLTVLVASLGTEKERKIIDYSSDSIKSKLLTLALMDEIFTRFRNIDAAARFTEESLFSPMYDKEYVTSILQWKNFAQAKTEFDKALLSVMSQDGDVATIQLDALRSIIGDSISLRWKETVPPYKKPDLFAYVSFLNNQAEWNITQK